MSHTTSDADRLAEARRWRWGPPEERFWPKVVKQPGGCWIWTGRINTNGYGRFRYDGRDGLAHRFAYEQAKGAIPARLHIDHLCKVRNCVNPDHLEAVSHVENNRRSDSPSGLNSRKTACNQGHPLAGENLYIDPEGKRKCRECKRRQRGGVS